MELIRNLPYASVGITDGTPVGVLERSTTTTVNNVEITIRRTVRYVDDPFDDFDPIDTDPNDYKFVQIDVSCDVCNQQMPVSLSTYVVSTTTQ